jgi:4-hydroxybenzoate polyprenyltransferase
VRAYLQLVRLPNVFTAMADILLGFLLTHRRLDPWPQFALLLVASCLLYLAGMVLNDYFDREQDARERPFRPIP